MAGAPDFIPAEKEAAPDFIPAQADSSKGFFDPSNAAAKDPFAFSREYAAAHPAQPQSTWQKIKNYATNALKPWEGAMAPRNVEEALSGAEMFAGELGGELLGPFGKSVGSAAVKKGIQDVSPTPTEKPFYIVPKKMEPIPGITPGTPGAPAAGRPVTAQYTPSPEAVSLTNETEIGPKPIAPVVAPTRIPSVQAPAPRMSETQRIGNLLDERLGIKPLEPKTPLREQFKAPAGETDPLKVKYPDPAERQMVRANGEQIVQAVGKDKALMKQVHDLTRVELRQALINSGEDMGQQIVGNSKFAGEGAITREEAFNRLLSKGHSPTEIVKLAKTEHELAAH